MENHDINLNGLLSNEEIDPNWLSLDLNSWAPPPPPTEAVIALPSASASSSIDLPSPCNNVEDKPSAAQSHSSRHRRSPTQAPHAGKQDTILPPYPWATNRRATVHSLNHLSAHGITSVEGEVHCRRCGRRERLTLDIQTKFDEIKAFILSNYHMMHDRAPAQWMSPAFAECGACEQPGCVRPVVAGKKRYINWLFLFLGQMLGCCTLDQLKYFCKHTQNHRTGAKDRVLFIAYVTICKQLVPGVSHHPKTEQA